MSATASGSAGGAPRRRRALIPLLAALAALAWAALWAWGRSPYGRYLQHEDWSAPGPAASLCQTIPGGGVLLPLALHALAWVLMTAAMMLPTTLPLFNAFDRIAAARPDRARLLLLLALGYVAAWGGFGLVAHGLQAMLLALVAAIPALARHGWLIGAAVIALAGAFQFSRLKSRCLDKCRSPLSFVMQRWRGQAQRWHAFALGVQHGAYCVGCCWALMLLMFAVGAGSLGWMLLFAAVMALEKNLPWGRRLSAPLGAALLCWAALIPVFR
jgi:predicted metal-binding membrane protein